MGKHKITSSMESNTRRIRIEPEQNPKYIIFTRKIGGVAEAVDEYMTYHPELQNILMLDCLKPYRNNGYLKFKVYDGESETVFTIYDLALGCYTGRIHYQTYLSDLQAFLAEKNAYDLVIDHADSNFYNHTVYNLSLMARQENSQKGGIVAQFKVPARVSVAYVDAKYRVFVGNTMADLSRLQAMVNSIIGALFGRCIRFESVCDTRQLFICEDANSLIRCLRFIAEHTVEGCEIVRLDRGTPKQDGECWYMDIHKSIAEQERLAAMNPECFDAFDSLSFEVTK